MKKLKLGFWGLHHCNVLKRWCDGTLTRERVSARERQAASWKRAGRRFSELKR